MMKIKFLVVIILSIFVSAQAKFINSYGFKSGVNLGYRDFESVGFLQDESKRLGFNICFYIEMINNRYFNILTEVHYKLIKPYEYNSYKKQREKEMVVIWELERLDYLSFPLLIKIGYPLKHMRLYYIFGPRLDVFVDARCLNSEGKISNPENEFGRFTFGFDFGGGINVFFYKIILISPEIRFSFDFTHSKGYYYPPGRNRAYLFMIGLGF